MQIYKKCSVNTLAVGWMAHGNSMPWMVAQLQNYNGDVQQ